MTTFNVPSNWIGEEVEVSENFPMQNKSGALTFPQINGKLLEVLEGSIVIEAQGKGKLLIPMHLIHGIVVPSRIKSASGLVLS